MMPPFPRPSNEVWAMVELLQQALSGDKDPRLWVQVVKGVDPEAKVVGVRQESDWVVISYDRPVEEPSFRSLLHEG